MNKTLDINAPGVKTEIAREIHKSIERWAAETYDDGFRWHLGGSVIGQECLRAIWYGFRWCGHMKFKGGTVEERLYEKGRMMRLFQRGHKEEFSFVKYLRATGWTVYDYATRLVWCSEHDHYDNVGWWDDKSTWPCGSIDVSEDQAHIERAESLGQGPKQWRISQHGGHFGGSLDGIAIPPPELGLGDTAFLLEFKTSGNNAGFRELQAKGVAIGKRQHFSQMCTYGADDQYKLTHGLYVAVNKDNDILHVDIVELDHNRGKQMSEKALRVITSQTAPPRLSENKTYYKCKFCDFFDICHDTKPVEKNCRSCKFSEPRPNGTWHCLKHDKPLIKDQNEDLYKNGCSDWHTVNDI